MRCFIACLIHPACADALLREAAKAIDRNAEARRQLVRLLPPENLHITLRFFGELDDEAVALVCKEVTRLENCRPISLTIDTFGVFPKRGVPRVFWAGASQTPEAMHALIARCDTIGFGVARPKKTRLFFPHITLARANKGVGSAERDRWCAHELRPINLDCINVALVSSVCLPQGSQYRTLTEALLAP